MVKTDLPPLYTIITVIEMKMQKKIEFILNLCLY